MSVMGVPQPTIARPRRDAASIDALRARMRVMGGVMSVAPPRRATAIPATDRAVAMGFAHVATAKGAIFVRRTTVDAGEELQWRGSTGEFEPSTLLGLVAPRRRPNLPRFEARDVVALDIESLGLRGSGVVPFLVGVGYIEGGHATVDQYLLANPDGEGAMLAAIADVVAAAALLLTYNGKSFDIPVLASRGIVTRTAVDGLHIPFHLDVLTAVRRLFRDSLGVCTLQNAEAGVLDFHRRDDVPGAEAPERFRRWFAGAPAALLDGVIEHNHRDVVSTLLIAARAASHVAGARVEPKHPSHPYLLARHVGDPGVADALYRETYDAACDPWRHHAGFALGRRLMRQTADDVAEAAAIFRNLWQRDRRDLRSARTLTVALRKLKRHNDALAVCEAVLADLASMHPIVVSRIRGAPAHGWMADWQRRRDRQLTATRAPERRLSALAAP